MGLLANFRFARQRARGQGARPCGHLDQIRAVGPSRTGRQPCVDLGDTWVHLRMCMTDGQVLCCDSSKNRHASRHARWHAPTHQIVRSMEPGRGLAVVLHRPDPGRGAGGRAGRVGGAR